MKKRELLKVCKIELGNIKGNITKCSLRRVNDNCDKLVIEFDSTFIDDMVAGLVAKDIANKLSNKYVDVNATAIDNKIYVNFNNYDVAKFAKLDAEYVSNKEGRFVILKSITNVILV